MKFFKLILGIICSNLSINQTNVNSLNIDTSSYLSKLCESNNISFTNLTDSSYSIETNNQLTSYEFNSDSKLTYLNYFEKNNLKTIKNTYSYDNSKLTYAETNGQIFEKKNNLNDSEEIETYYINKELLETIKSTEDTVTKEFSNGQRLHYSKKDNSISINNDNEIIHLVIDADDNVLQEYSDEYSIKNEYQDNALLSREFENFSYLKNDEKETYTYKDKSSIDTIEYIDDNYNYKINSKDELLIKDKQESYSLNINSNNITYYFNETNNDYKSRYINEIYFNNNLLFSYQYDSYGNIINENYLGKETNYNYDVRGQITSFQKENNTYTYSYDDRGNIIEEVVNGNQINFKYNNDKLINLNDAFLSYDLYGNLTSFNNQQYTYKNGNRLSEFSDGNISINYNYDSNGLRINKTTDNEEIKYFYIDNKLIYESNGLNFTRYFYDKNDEILGFEYDNNDYFYIKDCVGCIRKIIDSNGNVLVNYDYDPWGNILSIEDNSGNQLSKINHILYKGYLYDFDSNLYYLLSRYYSPVFHRFISIDNLEVISARGTEDLNLNLYTYSDNNPIMKRDNLGYCATAIIVGSCVISITSLLIYLVGIILICSSIIVVNEIITRLNNSGITTSAKTALTDSKLRLKKVIDEMNSIAKKVFGIWLLTRWKWWDNTYRNQYEIHHIIAQSSFHHYKARKWLKENYNENINCEQNLATIKKLLHKHLHTKYYYETTTFLLSPYRENKREEFFAVLASIKIGLLAISEALPN